MLFVFGLFNNMHKHIHIDKHIEYSIFNVTNALIKAIERCLTVLTLLLDILGNTMQTTLDIDFMEIRILMSIPAKIYIMQYYHHFPARNDAAFVNITYVRRCGLIN